jgi:CheY-like chemotaxis protein
MASTLLLADDSLTIRKVIELTFADEDIRVVTASNGREAIERITAEPPDIILADVGMPEHDGYEVAAFVKKAAHLAHIPVLLLAGVFEPVDHARARNVGCDGVLVKPFEPQLVISRVRELLSSRQGANRSSSPNAPGDAAVEQSEGRDSDASPVGGNYLDRLDAAFSVMSASPRPPSSPTPFEPPTTSTDVGKSAWNPQIVTNSGEPLQAANEGASGAETAGTTPSLSDAFVALLSAERGTPSGSSPPLPPVSLSDATLDEIARRVIARLGDESMRRAVLDAAERLVKEEIDRIKKAQQGPAGGA